MYLSHTKVFPVCDIYIYIYIYICIYIYIYGLPYWDRINFYYTLDLNELTEQKGHYLLSS